MVVSPVSHVTSPTFREQVENSIADVSEEFNLGDEVDGIRTGYLEAGVIAQTRFDGDKTEIVFDRNSFSQLPEQEKRKVTLHELLHVKQFNNSLGTWLKQNFNASERFVREFASRKTVDDMEGEVELIIDKIFPDILASSYPHQKERRERELKQKGIDPGKELMKEIDRLDEKILNYRETGAVYGQVTDIQDYSMVNIESDYLDSFDDNWSEVDSYLDSGGYRL